MKFTQIPTDTFQHLQMNAGILVDTFQPSSGVIGSLLGATTGGIEFRDNVSYTDFGDDIDNCPKNMLELKRTDSHEVTMSGTFITINADTAKLLAAGAETDPLDATHIIPRQNLKDSDFTELWWIGDYSNINTGDNAGFLAIRLMNALNTGGFQIRSTDRNKGQFAFTFTGHYSMSAQDTVPFEIYVKRGVAPSVTLSATTLELTVEGTETLTATTSPDEQVITWSTSNAEVATVSDAGLVTAVAAGTATITATMTVDGESYYDTCTVTVTEGA